MITKSKLGIYKPKIHLTKLEQKDIECMAGNTKSTMQDKNWKCAIENEYRALLKNKTWEPVKPNNSMKIVGSK